MLRSYKEIADRISKIWGGVSVTAQSVMRWSHMVEDPLPVKRIKPRGVNGKRAIVVAETAAIERWAQRRIS